MVWQASGYDNEKTDPAVLDPGCYSQRQDGNDPGWNTVPHGGGGTDRGGTPFKEI